ncbi:MAG: FtsQ-type POTRA domain-containing protein [bacterium]
MRKRQTYKHPKVYYTQTRRAKERKPLQKSNLLILLSLLAAALIAWVLFFSPVFSIKSVFIDGAEKVTKESIQEQLQIPKQQNIFLFNERPMASRLYVAFPLLQTITVEKKLFPSQSLLIHLKEKKPFVLWKIKDKTYGVDEKGILFAEYLPADGENLLTIGGYPVDEAESPIGQKLCNPTMIEYINLFLPKVQAIMKQGITRVEAIDTHDFQFIMEKGLAVKFSIDKDPLTPLTKLQELLEKKDMYNIQPKQYIDLRNEQIHLL